MQVVIQPTIGRQVWYTPSSHEINAFGLRIEGDQPMAATVVFVHDERSVNLSVLDHNGNQFTRNKVGLLQGDDAAPEGEQFCQWMPYQQKQAETAAEAATDTTGA